MLPAVRAAYNVAPDPLEAARTVVVRASPTIPAAIDPSADDAALPISGGRLSALSLSAQLQLGQSFSVIADTIGRLLELPRGDNETLVDYSQRLSQAVQALPLSERVAVERLLNQIAKGVPLRLLAELLKNPSGADAARLVALLEGNAPANRDLAAKAAVGSYRQNAAPGLPAPPSLPPAVAAATAGARDTAANAAPPAGSSSPQPAMPEPERPSAPAPAAKTPPAAASMIGKTTDRAAASAASVSKNSLALPSNHPPVQANPLQAADPVPAEEASARTRQLPSSPQASPASLASSAAGETGPQGTMRLVAQPQQELAKFGAQAPAPASASAQEGDLPATSSSPMRSNPVIPGETRDLPVQNKIQIYDAMALVRLLQETVQQDQALPGTPSLPRPAEGVAALVDWLARLFGEAEEAAHPPSAYRPTPPAEDTWPADEIPLNRASIEAEGGRTVSMPAQAPVAADGAPDLERPAALHPAAAGSAATAPELIEGSLAAAALPVLAQPRDGIGWFQAPYPPAEEEPRREERKARAIAAIKDEDDGASREHGFHQERQKDEAADPDEAAREEGAEAGDEQGKPADFYWRLAGWA